jgi:hypothetical protein
MAGPSVLSIANPATVWDTFDSQTQNTLHEIALIFKSIDTYEDRGIKWQEYRHNINADH